jgi:hypothetical protein
MDVMWNNSPKFREGQVGIWLLHKNQIMDPKIRRLDVYTAILRENSYSMSELARIKRLVKELH